MIELSVRRDFGSQGVEYLKAAIAGVVSEKGPSADVERDAARYRFLRECRFLEIITASDQMFRVAGGDNLDKVVDQAATP